MTYLVGLGGSPPDQRDEYDDFASALEAARVMAVEMAERNHEDPADIDTWGEDDPDIGAGACPSNCDGAYWPHVTWVG